MCTVVQLSDKHLYHNIVSAAKPAVMWLSGNYSITRDIGFMILWLWWRSTYNELRNNMVLIPVIQPGTTAMLLPLCSPSKLASDQLPSNTVAATEV